MNLVSPVVIRARTGNNVLLRAVPAPLNVVVTCRRRFRRALDLCVKPFAVPLSRVATVVSAVRTPVPWLFDPHRLFKFTEVVRVPNAVLPRETLHPLTGLTLFPSVVSSVLIVLVAALLNTEDKLVLRATSLPAPLVDLLMSTLKPRSRELISAVNLPHLPPSRFMVRVVPLSYRPTPLVSDLNMALMLFIDRRRLVVVLMYIPVFVLTVVSEVFVVIEVPPNFLPKATDVVPVPLTVVMVSAVLLTTWTVNMVDPTLYSILFCLVLNAPGPSGSPL